MRRRWMQLALWVVVCARSRRRPRAEPRQRRRSRRAPGGPGGPSAHASGRRPGALGAARHQPLVRLRREADVPEPEHLLRPLGRLHDRDPPLPRALLQRLGREVPGVLQRPEPERALLPGPRGTARDRGWRRPRLRADRAPVLRERRAPAADQVRRRPHRPRPEPHPELRVDRARQRSEALRRGVQRRDLRRHHPGGDGAEPGGPARPPDVPAAAGERPGLDRGRVGGRPAESAGGHVQRLLPDPGDVRRPVRAAAVPRPRRGADVPRSARTERDGRRPRSSPRS